MRRRGHILCIHYVFFKGGASVQEIPGVASKPGRWIFAILRTGRVYPSTGSQFVNARIACKDR